ncbi:Endonuclease/exonuclease/phosphatase [Corchorus capsularis]|uniref:Endonuclease/exonuclease/phosphatase n=1 Tax=Corchorus capsularis TaxID=210143 RepID=A0A1R3FVM6_COCAP|nr:Endonuclease/exonuclease/phosphatase [Corchorus capsularis]
MTNQAEEGPKCAEVGPWMMVQRRKGSNQSNKGQSKGSSPHQDKASGSRFAPLHMEEQDKPNDNEETLAAKETSGIVVKTGKNIPTHHQSTSPPLRHDSGKAKPLQEITNRPPPVPRPKPAVSPTRTPLFVSFPTSSSAPALEPGGVLDELSSQETNQSPTVNMDEPMLGSTGGEMLHMMEQKIWRESVDSMDADLTSNTSLMKILLWNVRGAGSGEFFRIMKDLIRQHQPSIVGIMETRISQEKAEKVVRKIELPKCHIVEGLGFVGGIWLLWDDKKVDVQIDDSMFQAITISVKQDNNEWNFTTVYGSPAPTNREELWRYLGDENHSMQGPWLVGGDFNTIASSADKSNFSSHDTSRCRRFNEVINSCELVDLGFTGPRYTWKRSGRGIATIWERLDRFLCNIEWKQKFPEALVRHLPRVRSDHCPYST